MPSDSVSALLYPLNITHETFFPGTGCQIRSGHKPWDCSPDVEGGIWPEVCSKHRHMLQIKKRLLFFLCQMLLLARLRALVPTLGVTNKA